MVAVSLTTTLFHCSSPPEPTSVDIHVDGVNDICTKGGDINFVFTGFSVNGKVRLLFLLIPCYVNSAFIKNILLQVCNLFLSIYILVSLRFDRFSAKVRH